jgi:hypothetical protein
MAIEMRQELMGFTAEQAEAVAALVNARAKTAPGFIAHASGPIPGGYHVTEWWESRKAFERFSDEVIGPQLHLLGVTGPFAPPRYLPVTNFVTRDA